MATVQNKKNLKTKNVKLVGAKQSVKKQKIKTFAQKLTKKKKPVKPSKTMEQYNAKRVHSDLEFLAGKSDLGFLQPSSQVHNPDIGSVLEAIDAVLIRLSMTTEIFNYPTGIPPAYIGMYLEMAFLTYVKLYGDLTGTYAGLVPTSMDNWALPLPFAKFLQGYGRYSENGCVFRTAYSHNNFLQISRDVWAATGDGNIHMAPVAGTGAAAGYPYGNNNPSLLPVLQAGNNLTMFMSPIQPGNNDELIPVNNPLPGFGTIVEANFSSTIMTIVAEAIASSGMAYVMGNDVPGIAPDASAYTFISEDVNPVVPVVESYAHYLASVADNFNPEIALIYSKHHPIDNPLPGSPSPTPIIFSKKCICHGSDDSAVNGAPMWYFQPLHTAVFVLSTYKKYPLGPMNNLKYCKVPLTTLFPVPQRLHYQGAANIFNQHYLSVLDYWMSTSTTTGFPDSTTQYYWVYWVMCSMALIARLNRSVPYYRFQTYIRDPSALFSTGINTIQSMFASNGWLMHKFPPLIANLITDVGPVVYRGRIYYPDFLVRKYTAGEEPYDNPGSVWSPLLNGFVSPLAPPGVPTPSFLDTYMLEVVPSPKSYDLHGVAFNAAMARLSLGEVGASYFQPIFTLNAYAGTIASTYYQFYSFVSLNNTLNNSLIHMHYEKCGATHLMLTRLSGTPYYVNTLMGFYNTGNYPTAVQTLLDPFKTYKPVCAQVGSLVQDNPGHIVLALMYMMAWDTSDFGGTTYLTGAHAPFVIRLATSVSPNSYISSLLQETHSAQSTFSTALAARESVYSDKVASGVVSLIIPPHEDHCFIGDLFNTALNGVSSVLRYAVGAVGGAACSVGVTALGQPELVGVAEPLCSAGAMRLYDYIASRVGVDANNIKTTNSTAGRGGKVSKGNVHAATKQLRASSRTMKQKH